MRVLFTAPPGVGHLHPQLPLAHAMVARGHDVRFATDEGTCAVAARAGLQTAPAGMDAGRRRELMETQFGVDLRSVAPRNMSDLMVPYAFAGVGAPAMAEDLRRLFATWPPDLLIHDQLELAAPLMAAELGVHHVARSFGSTVPEHRLAASTEVIRPLWAEADRTVPPLCGVFDDMYVDIRPPSLPGHPPAGTRVLFERAQPIDAVGGELPALVSDRDGKPLVYVTLGTVFTDDAVFRSAVEGLGTLDVRVLVTVGPKGDPAAIGPVPDNVHVTRYVPQPALLPHCAAVVCHGGSGTFLGALTHGVPLLFLPQGADQFLNADATVEVGAGLSLEGAAATATAIRDAVSELLESASYRSAAQMLAKEIAAMPSADEVAATLEDLAGS